MQDHCGTQLPEELKKVAYCRGAGAGPAGPAATGPKLRRPKWFKIHSCKSQRFAEPQAKPHYFRILLPCMYAGWTAVAEAWFEICEGQHAMACVSHSQFMNIKVLKNLPDSISPDSCRPPYRRNNANLLPTPLYWEFTTILHWECGGPKQFTNRTKRSQIRTINCLEPIKMYSLMMNAWSAWSKLASNTAACGYSPQTTIQVCLTDLYAGENGLSITSCYDNNNCRAP